MQKIKIAGITITGTVTALLIISLFSPYNFFMKINEDSIINDPGIEVLFSGDEIKDVTYQGSNTYTLSIAGGEFVAVQEYYSIMNYKWHVYEKTMNGEADPPQCLQISLFPLPIFNLFPPHTKLQYKLFR